MTRANVKTRRYSDVDPLLDIDVEESTPLHTLKDNEDFEQDLETCSALLEVTDEKKTVAGWSWVLLVVAVASPMFFYCIDKSVTTILIPTIVGELGEASKLPWVFVGFGLGSLSLALSIGKLYSLYNTKHLYLGFLAIFTLGSALCGSAWRMDILIFGRILAGAGGIGVQTGIMTLISTLTNENQRPAYMSGLGLFWSIGRIVGPLFGGALGKTAWRWGFHINVVICGLFAPVYIFLVPSINPLPNVPLRTRHRRIDWVGALLSISATIALFMGINSGGTRFAWSSSALIAILASAAGLFMLFAYQQTTCLFTTSTDRLFPIRMIFIPEVCLIFIASATCSIAAFLPANFISLYFQFTRGDSSLDAALRLLPMIIAMAIVMPASGYFIPRIGHLELWPVIGSLVTLPGMLAMVYVDVNTNTAVIYIAEALVGAGTGSYIQVAYTMVTPYVLKSEKQAGLCFILLSQMGGIALSISASSAVFTNLGISRLSNLLPDMSKQEIENALSGTSGLLLETLPVESRDAVLDILVTAMRPAWIIGTIATVVGIVASVKLMTWGPLWKAFIKLMR